MIIYVCDSCQKEFKNPLDEIQVQDKKTIKKIDVCAECKSNLEDNVDSYRKSKLLEVLKKRNSK